MRSCCNDYLLSGGMVFLFQQAVSSRDDRLRLRLDPAMTRPTNQSQSSIASSLNNGLTKSLRRFRLRFARSFAFGRRRGAKSLPLQPFHHHSRAGMALFGQLTGFRDEILELFLDFLRFLERRVLAALHHTQVTPLHDKLDRLKSEIKQQRDQRNDERQIRSRRHGYGGFAILYRFSGNVFNFVGHATSLLRRRWRRGFRSCRQIDAAFRQKLLKLFVIGF